MTTINDNLLVKHLYQETNDTEREAIELMLATDEQVRVRYAELAAARRDIDAAQSTPSARTIQRILDYARTQAGIIR